MPPAVKIVRTKASDAKKVAVLLIRVVQAQMVEGVVEFVTIREYGMGDIHIKRYINEANRLQQEFDKDMDPVRVYVLEDGIPVFAGLSSKESRMQIFGWNDTHVRKAA
jgi:hypothetical protein